MGLLFAFAVVVGGELYRNNSIAGLASSPVTVLANIAFALGMFAVGALAALGFSALQKRLSEKPPRSVPSVLGSRKAAFCLFALAFLCWLPCLLAYWPGLLTYDFPTQMDFVFEGSWTTQQPPLHTLVWWLVVKLEGVCGLHAVTWYALLQMAFLACAFAYLLSYLAKRGVSLVLWVLAALFCTVNPVVALFAISPVKDTMLAGVLVFVLVLIAQLIGSPSAFAQSKARCCGLVVGLFACCLLRDNMLVAVGLFAVVSVVVMKGNRKTIALLCGIPLVAALVVIGPVYSAAGISSGGSAIASVPIQQVANVVSHHGDELSADEQAAIDAVLPFDRLQDSYVPRFADTTVRLFKARPSSVGSMRESIIDFLKVWAGFIPRYPLEMFDAFATLNVPYWYPFAQTPDPSSQRDYIETSVWKTSDYYTVEPDSKLPALREAYEAVASYAPFNNPLLGLVFSPSSAWWYIVFATYLLYASGARRNVLLVMLPLLFWLSFLVGPVSNMRYMFPIFCLYPLLVCAALQPAFVIAQDRKSS